MAKRTQEEKALAKQRRKAQALIKTPRTQLQTIRSFVAGASRTDSIRLDLSHAMVMGSTYEVEPPEPPVTEHIAEPGTLAYNMGVVVAGARAPKLSYARVYLSGLQVMGERWTVPATRLHTLRVLVSAGQSTKYTPSKLSIYAVRVAGTIGPTLRGFELYSWYFDQDGHIFYVLQVGQLGTFVYDLATGKWSQWKTSDSSIWEAVRGIEYKGDNLAIRPNSADIVRVIPEGAVDAGNKPLERIVTAYLKLTARSSLPIGCLYVDASSDVTGQDETTMLLQYSDDEGRTWVPFRRVTLPLPLLPGHPVAFRSLGLVKYPGKLFQLVDTGGPIRISGLDVNIPVVKRPQE